MIVKPKIFQSTGTYKVRFLYLDIVNGVLTYKMLERYVNSGGTVTPPAIPITLAATAKRSCALEFVEWNYSNANLTNITQDIDVGAVYRNATSGGIRKTHVFIVATANTGLAVPIYFNKSDGSTLTISWGDGSANYTTTSSGNVNTTHTYSSEGAYEITMWISSGSGTYSFSNGSGTTNFIGGNNNNYRKTLENIFIGDNVPSISTYGFYNMLALKKVNIPNTVTSMSTYTFGFCRSLENIIVPAQCITIDNYSFQNCDCCRNIFLGYGVTTLGTNVYYSTSSLFEHIIPNSVTSMGSNLFIYGNISEIKLSTSITDIPASAFDQALSLVNIEIPQGVTTINNYAFSGAYCIPKLTIPSSVTSIGTNAFGNCHYLKVLTVKYFSAPSTITTLGVDGFYTPNPQLRIYVPVGSGAVYKAATNWSTYANRIYEDTAQNRAIFGD